MILNMKKCAKSLESNVGLIAAAVSEPEANGRGSSLIGKRSQNKGP